MVKKVFLLIFSFALFASTVTATTVTKTVSELVTENGWTVSAGSNIGTLATNFQLDEIVSISTSGEANCGSIWGTSPDNDWRIYQAKQGDITIAVSSGLITSIKLKFGTKITVV